MKKINFKAILVVLLVLVLAFAMVACNNDKEDKKDPTTPGDKTPGGTTPGGTTPGGTTPSGTTVAAKDFFDELWARSASIGNSGKIEEGKNFYAHADLELGVGLMLDLDNPQPSDLLTHFGVELEAVIDRESKNSEGSAIKARLYAGTNNILTVYFFMNDTKNLYIDFDGQQIKVNAQLLKKDSTDEYYNDDLGGLLNGFINGNDVKKYLDLVMTDTGEGWTLNTLIKNIIGMLGIDLEELKGQSIVTQVANALGVNVDDVFTENGINVAALLGAPKLGGFFSATKDGNKYHLASTDSLGSLLGTLAGMNLNIGIDFEAEGEDGFKNGVTITAGLPDIKGKATIGDRQRNVYPYATVAIKSLNFAPATDKAIAITKTNYTDKVALEIVEKLDFDGIKFKETTFAIPGLQDATLDIEASELGDIEIGLKGQVDLANSENNATKAMAYISYGGKNIITASFANGALGVKIDRTVKLAGIPVIDTVVQYAGDSLYNLVKDSFFHGVDTDNALATFANLFFTDASHTAIKDDFKGVVVEGINVYDLLANAILGAIQNPPAPDSPAPDTGAAQTSAEMRTFDMELISDLFSTILPAFTGLSDGKIQLGTTNGLQLICDIVNTLYGLPIMNGRTEVEPAWTVKGCITSEDLAPSFEFIAPYLDELLDTTGILMTEEQVKSLLGLGANDELTRGQIWAATIMSALKADITLDLTSGLGWTIKAGFNDVSITYSSSIGMITKEAFDASFTDVAAEYKAATDKTGWFHGEM